MEYPSPALDIITIYSKSGCTYCKKAKTFLNSINKSFCMIDCDEFLLDNKADFMLFIKKLSNMDVTSFPIIFNGDTFIGGYNELVNAIQKNDNAANLLFEDSF